MNESTSTKRHYRSVVRTAKADANRLRILDSARTLFASQGIDAVTIAEIGKAASVAASTVYAIYKSKRGILRALMEQSLFGGRYQLAQRLLEGVTDPVEQVALTSHVSRAIYESESKDLGLLRNTSGFSPELREIELEFEQLRYEMQEDRLARLFVCGRARVGLTLDDARRIMWMYTSRDVYRMLVIDGDWTPEKYQSWLSDVLLGALVEGY